MSQRRGITCWFKQVKDLYNEISYIYSGEVVNNELVKGLKGMSEAWRPYQFLNDLLQWFNRSLLVFWRNVALWMKRNAGPAVCAEAPVGRFPGKGNATGFLKVDGSSYKDELRSRLKVSRNRTARWDDL